MKRVFSRDFERERERSAILSTIFYIIGLNLEIELKIFGLHPRRIKNFKKIIRNKALRIFRKRNILL